MRETPEQITHRAIKRHAGLSEWDDEDVAAEVAAIFRELRKHYTLVPIKGVPAQENKNALRT